MKWDQTLEMVDENGKHICTFKAVKGIDIRVCPKNVLDHSLHGQLLKETIDQTDNITWKVKRGENI